MEAAFVVPLLLVIIIGVIYLGFFLHDSLSMQVIIQRNLREAAEHIRYCGNLETKEIFYPKIYKKINKTQLEKELEALLKKELEKGLFLTAIEEIQAEASLFSVKVTYITRFKVSFPGVQHLFPNGQLPKEEKAIIYNPMKTLRSIGGLADVESRI